MTKWFKWFCIISKSVIVNRYVVDWMGCTYVVSGITVKLIRAKGD